MVRTDPTGDGSLPSSWGPSTVEQGGVHVNASPMNLSQGGSTYRDMILATPGEG